MGAVELRRTGVQGNKVKRGRNAPTGRVLQSMSTDTKHRKSRRTVAVTGEDHGEAYQESKRSGMQERCIYLISVHRNINTGAKKPKTR